MRNLKRTLTNVDPLIGVMTVKSDGIIAFVSEGAERYTEGTRDTLIDTSFIDILSDPIKEPFEIGLRQLQDTGTTWLDGQRLALDETYADGFDGNVEVEVRIDEEQTPPGLRCVVRDHQVQRDYDQARLFQSALLTAQHKVSPDGIVIVSPEGEILFHNQLYAEIWGTPVEALETGRINEVRKIMATRVQDPDGIFFDGFQRYDGTREIARDELVLKDGRTLSRHTAPVLDEYDALLGRFWSYRDITEYRQMQRHVEEQREWLSALVDNNPDMVISLDLEGIIQSANPGTTPIYGYEPHELVGESRDMLISPERREQIFRHITEVERGQPQQFETISPHRDGHDVDVSVTLIPIMVAGEMVGHWAVVHDMTDAKRAKVELQRAQANLEEAQRISRIGSFEWDIPTGSLSWSDGLYQILKVEPESFEATFENFLQIVHSDDRGELMEKLERTFSTGEPYDMNLRMVPCDGSLRIMHAQGEVLIEENGSPQKMVGTAQDITERVRDEEAMQHVVSMLEEKSQALEQKTLEQESFIYSVSHDLRSPLISIEGLAEILKSDYGDVFDETGKKYLERILANIGRLQEMLTGLLELSRIGRTEKGSRHDVNLHALVTDIIDSLKETSAGREAEFQIEGELPTITAHHSRMTQLFSNLLDNALKYTPPERTPKIAVRSRETNRGWEVSVSDNGVGIPAEKQRAAVGMFSRLPEGQQLNPGGSGLGLAIATRIVSIHGGGTLNIDSTEGEGTTISFTLV